MNPSDAAPTLPAAASDARLPASFNRLVAANLGAQAAEQLSLAAVPIVAVLALHAGPAEIGMLSIAQTLPFMLLSIPFGLVADRMSRRRLMLVAEVVRALSLLGLLALVLLQQVSLLGTAVLGFVGACGTVAFSVAAPALVPSLVPIAQLGPANGRLELARSMAFAGGPALAGALVAWAGASSAFTLAAVLSMVAVSQLWKLPEAAALPASAAPRRIAVELREGAAFVWHHAWLRPILLTAVAWNLSWFVLQAAYVSHAIKAIGMSTQVLGLTLGCYGAGMVAGALVVVRLMKVLSVGQSIMLGPLFSVAASLTMVATLWWPSPWLAAFAFLLFGAGPIVWTVSTTTLRQTVTPAPLLGRATSIFLTANMGARPLGAALGAGIGAWGDEPACLVAAAIGFGLQAVIIMSSAVRRVQRL